MIISCQFDFCARFLMPIDRSLPIMVSLDLIDLIHLTNSSAIPNPQKLFSVERKTAARCCGCRSGSPWLIRQ
jgi:hypothetical protein